MRKRKWIVGFSFMINRNVPTFCTRDWIQELLFIMCFSASPSRYPGADWCWRSGFWVHFLLLSWRCWALIEIFAFLPCKQEEYCPTYCRQHGPVIRTLDTGEHKKIAKKYGGSRRTNSQPQTKGHSNWRSPPFTTSPITTINCYIQLHVLFPYHWW